MLKSILSNPTVQAIIAGQIRHAVTIGGTYLATSGLIQNSQVETFAGAATVLLALVWSAIQKKLAA